MSVVPGGDALGDHLVVGAIGAVGFGHRGDELVAGIDDGVTTMYWEPATGSGAAVRTAHSVVHV